ncbi:urease accessory UreF family protein [Kiritimatiellaeota bacterium B1221]|nr:urease accessory UreF family protein [Kiritimatiellaeota bacterium B1221]
MTAAALNWFHIADSAFPTGGFAFSSGIEASAKFGLFTSRQQFVETLQTAVEQWISYEIPFLNSCFDDAEDPVALRDVYHAGMSSPPMLRSSLVQGRSMLRSLESLVGADALTRTRERVPRSPERRHLLLVYGWGLAELGMPLAEAQSCFMYINLRDAISSAIRLGCMGPMEGHQIQHQLLQEGDRKLSRALNRNFRTARRTAPALEIAQAGHDRIYSKLFQS